MRWGVPMLRTPETYARVVAPVTAPVVSLATLVLRRGVPPLTIEPIEEN